MGAKRVGRWEASAAGGTRWAAVVVAELLAATGLLAGCSTSAPTLGAAVGCNSQGAAATAATTDYRLVLDLGPLSPMFSAGQVPSSAPPNAEVMLNGSMAAVSGSDAQHLEVHICNRRTGEVVAAADPTITLTDTTAGTTATVGVATMEGVGAGQSDLHYGNNVPAPIGHSFVATVTVHGQSATLRFTRSDAPPSPVPATSVPGSSVPATSAPGSSVPATSAPLGMDGMTH